MARHLRRDVLRAGGRSAQLISSDAGQVSFDHVLWHDGCPLVER